MKVSIITACYNREKTIATAIESVKEQSYKDIEYVIIDGLSKDRSMDIINSHHQDIDVIISEKDTGIYDALNKGIKNCSGDIIGLLHSDDFFYEKDTVKKVVEVFEKTGADIVYGNGMYVDEDDISKVKRIYRADHIKDYYFYFGWIPLHTTIYVKREVFDKYGLYDDSFRIASDYEISLRWFTNRNIKQVFLNDWVVKMRLGGKSTDMKQQKLKSSEDLRIIEKYNLWGKFTLISKIGRKIPQYILPRIFKYN